MREQKKRPPGRPATGRVRNKKVQVCYTDEEHSMFVAPLVAVHEAEKARGKEVKDLTAVSRLIAALALEASKSAKIVARVAAAFASGRA